MAGQLSDTRLLPARVLAAVRVARKQSAGVLSADVAVWCRLLRYESDARRLATSHTMMTSVDHCALCSD